MEDEIKNLLNVIIEGQQKKIYQLARQVKPNITLDDLLQPNDYPELENNPLFRYEEGVIEGVKTVQMALLALFKDKISL